LSAQEIASTLTAYRLASARCGRPKHRALAQFVSHSRPSGTVHRRSARTHPGRSRTVATEGERRSALFESVLGATLASSNLASSTLACDDGRSLCLARPGCKHVWLSLWPRTPLIRARCTRSETVSAPTGSQWFRFRRRAPCRAGLPGVPYASVTACEIHLIETPGGGAAWPKSQ